MKKRFQKKYPGSYPEIFGMLPGLVVSIWTFEWWGGTQPEKRRKGVGACP
jgi:hypothetical protein